MKHAPTTVEADHARFASVTSAPPVMRAYAATGPAGYVLVGTPAVGPQDVVIRVHACGIQRADAAAFLRGDRSPLWTDTAGRVVEVGDDVRDLRIGDHVVTTGRPHDCSPAVLTDHLVIRNATVGANVAILPAAVPWPAAVLAPTAARARRAVRRLGRATGQNALVFGAGPEGLSIALELRAHGARSVLVADLVSGRRDLAAELGLDTTTDPAGAASAVSRRPLGARNHHGARSGRLPVLFVDASGTADVAAHLATVARVGDTYASYNQPDSASLLHLLRRGVTVIRLDWFGADTDGLEISDFDQWHRRSVMVSHVFGPEQLHAAIDTAASAELSDKVVVVIPD